MMIKTVKEGDTIILKKESTSKIIKITNNKTVNLWKEKFKLNNLVGTVVGSCFKVDRGQLVKLTAGEINSHYDKSSDNIEEVEDDGPSETIEGDVIKDNRELIDDRANQKLTKEEIQGMRKKGVGGEAIVDNLIVNSLTFSKKTEYSKQKYVNKKNKKHVTIFTVLECNTRNLLDMYHCKGPTKICNLRMDSLSQIMCHANIQSGGRYLVVDGCVGLVLGSIMERLNGRGLLVNLYTGSAPSRPAINLSYQFNEQQMKVLHDYPLNNVAMLKQQFKKCCNPRDSVCHVNRIQNENTVEFSTSINYDAINNDINNINNNNINNNNNNINNNNNNININNINNNQTISAIITNINNNSGTDDNSDNKNDDDDGDNNDDDGDKNEEEEEEDDDDEKMEGKRKCTKPEPRLSMEERDRRRKERHERIEMVKSLINEDLFDGLIIASKLHTTPLLIHLLHLINPSRPIVIFSAYKEPLMDSYMYLKDTGCVVLLKMFESWLRSYQILPERSHPHVNMGGSGGYLLTGVTVQN